MNTTDGIDNAAAAIEAAIAAGVLAELVAAHDDQIQQMTAAADRLGDWLAATSMSDETRRADLRTAVTQLDAELARSHANRADLEAQLAAALAAAHAGGAL